MWIPYVIEKSKAKDWPMFPELLRKTEPAAHCSPGPFYCQFGSLFMHISALCAPIVKWPKLQDVEEERLNQVRKHLTDH